MKRPVRMIEPLQVKMIHTAVAALRLSDEDYRTILLGHYKKKSCKELTYFEASRLIDYFKSLGFIIPRRKKYTAGTSSRQDFRNIPRKEPAGQCCIDAVAGTVGHD